MRPMRPAGRASDHTSQSNPDARISRLRPARVTKGMAASSTQSTPPAIQVS